ncbi:MAG: histidine phosphatase family protein [Ilumatobacteraceae bacterium]
MPRPFEPTAPRTRNYRGLRMTAPESLSNVPASHRQLPYTPSPGATEFVLVRHGASAAFVPGQPFPLCEGHGDPELDPSGVLQAQRVADRLVDERVDAIYVTPRGTAQTIAPFLERTGRTASVICDLREVFLGEWEGGQVPGTRRRGHPLALEMFRDRRLGPRARGRDQRPAPGPMHRRCRSCTHLSGRARRVPCTAG